MKFFDTPAFDEKINVRLKSAIYRAAKVSRVFSFGLKMKGIDKSDSFDSENLMLGNEILRTHLLAQVYTYFEEHDQVGPKEVRITQSVEFVDPDDHLDEPQVTVTFDVAGQSNSLHFHEGNVDLADEFRYSKLSFYVLPTMSISDRILPAATKQ